MIINCSKFLGLSLFNPLNCCVCAEFYFFFAFYTLYLFVPTFKLIRIFFASPHFHSLRPHVVSIIYFKPCISVKHAFDFLNTLDILFLASHLVDSRVDRALIHRNAQWAKERKKYTTAYLLCWCVSLFFTNFSNDGTHHHVHASAETNLFGFYSFQR